MHRAVRNTEGPTAPPRCQGASALHLGKEESVWQEASGPLGVTTALSSFFAPLGPAGTFTPSQGQQQPAPDATVRLDKPSTG